MRQAVTLAARVTQRTRLLGTAWGRWRKVTANMVLESHLHEVRQEHDARVGSETKARWLMDAAERAAQMERQLQRREAELHETLNLLEGSTRAEADAKIDAQRNNAAVLKDHAAAIEQVEVKAAMEATRREQQHCEELKRMSAQMDERLAAAGKDHSEKLESLRAAYRTHCDVLRKEHSESVARFESERESALEDWRTTFESRANQVSSHHSKVVEELKSNLAAATHHLQSLEEKERHSSRALEACEVDRQTAVGRLFDLTMKANGQRIYNILLAKYDHEKGATANAFRTWSKFVVTLKAAMERGLFAEGVAGKWMKTMLLRHMMVQWKGYLKTYRLMKRVFARLVSRSLVQAMQKWKAVFSQLIKLAGETQAGFTRVSEALDHYVS